MTGQHRERLLARRASVLERIRTATRGAQTDSDHAALADIDWELYYGELAPFPMRLTDLDRLHAATGGRHD